MESNQKINVLKLLYEKIENCNYIKHSSHGDLDDIFVQIDLFIKNDTPIKNHLILRNRLYKISSFAAFESTTSVEASKQSFAWKKNRALQFIRTLIDTIRIYELKDIPNTEIQLGTIFMDDQSFDATSKILDIIQIATKKLILIDNYVDRQTLKLLGEKQRGVDVFIITRTNRIDEASLDAFYKQYGHVKVVKNDRFHDRYIITDDKNVFMIGASIKDIGGKVTTVCKISDTIDIITKANELLD